MVNSYFMRTRGQDLRCDVMLHPCYGVRYNGFSAYAYCHSFQWLIKVDSNLVLMGLGIVSHLLR